MWKYIPHIGKINKREKMRSEAELTLMVLECYLKHGPALSIQDLCTTTNISEKKMKYILSILEKRKYVRRSKNTDEYTLSNKIAMLI